MRINSPVTQKAYEFDDSETLLSTTDTKGRIRYANASFISTSGFDATELIGQPHNMVRHPDMPAEAFADMWRCLQQGHSWTALVKNRRKDGDHYWVRANAAPMVREGVLTGYISVRTKPRPAEVHAAQHLYQRFQENKAKGWGFHRGLVVRTGLLRVLSAQQLLPAVWRVRLPLLLLGFLLTGGLAQSVANDGSLAVAIAALWSGLAMACWTIEAQLVRPLARVRAFAQQIASGALPQDLNLTRCDDVGQIVRSLSQASLNLHALMADVREQVSGVQVVSKEIASANLDLSSRTEHTASSLEQTAAAMEQQSATLRQNSATAMQASARVKEASEAAERGGVAMAQVVSTMSEISDSSRRIADIIGVIDGIAFQTNILALNAAVEAARAGDQGRGFAVVAGEVRNLAGRSAVAAKEIKVLIDESVATVTGGSARVANAGHTMTEVVQQVQKVHQLIGEISVATQEQSLGVGQVNQAVAQLDQMTQQNAAMVEQSSAAATSMSDQASRLMAAVRVFSKA